MKTNDIVIAVPHSKAGLALLETLLLVVRAHRDPSQANVDTAEEAISLERELGARIERARVNLADKTAAALPA